MRADTTLEKNATLEELSPHDGKRPVCERRAGLISISRLTDVKDCWGNREG
jgi:hypothetical protein